MKSSSQIALEVAQRSQLQLVAPSKYSVRMDPRDGGDLATGKVLKGQGGPVRATMWARYEGVINLGGYRARPKRGLKPFQGSEEIREEKGTKGGLGGYFDYLAKPSSSRARNKVKAKTQARAAKFMECVLVSNSWCFTHNAVAFLSVLFPRGSPDVLE